MKNSWLPTYQSLTLVCRLIPYHKKVDHISQMTTCAGKNAKQKIFAHFASSQVKMVNRLLIQFAFYTQIQSRTLVYTHQHRKLTLIYKEIQILHPNLALHIHKPRLIWNSSTPFQWIHFLLCLCKLATVTVIEYHTRCRIIVMHKQGHIL